MVQFCIWIFLVIVLLAFLSCFGTTWSPVSARQRRSIESKPIPFQELSSPIDSLRQKRKLQTLTPLDSLPRRRLVWCRDQRKSRDEKDTKFSSNDSDLSRPAIEGQRSRGSCFVSGEDKWLFRSFVLCRRDYLDPALISLQCSQFLPIIQGGFCPWLLTWANEWRHVSRKKDWKQSLLSQKWLRRDQIWAA